MNLKDTLYIQKYEQFNKKIAKGYLQNLNWLWKILNIKPNEKVLEIGCNKGYLMIPLLSSSNNVYGVDLSIYDLNLAKKYSKSSTYLLQSDALYLPFNDKIFDFIIAFHTLEHIPNSKKIISELARVIKKGGLFAIALPYRSNQWAKFFNLMTKKLLKQPSWYQIHVAQHISVHNPKLWERLISKEGFKLVYMKALTIMPPIWWIPFLNSIGADNFLNIRVIRKIDEMLSGNWNVVRKLACKYFMVYKKLM